MGSCVNNGNECGINASFNVGPSTWCSGEYGSCMLSEGSIISTDFVFDLLVDPRFRSYGVGYRSSCFVNDDNSSYMLS